MNPEICKNCIKFHSRNETNKKALNNNGIKEIEFVDFKFNGEQIDVCWIYIHTKYKINMTSYFCRKIYYINELPADIIKNIRRRGRVTCVGSKINEILKKLNPDKRCCYYFEHQLSNWNNDNNS